VLRKSIGANLAEGVGQWIPGNKLRYYRYAQGSASECSSHMDMIRVMGFADESLEGWVEAAERIDRIGAWVKGLIDQTEARAAGRTLR
jgi:four helix bundle protein